MLLVGTVGKFVVIAVRYRWTAVVASPRKMLDVPLSWHSRSAVRCYRGQTYCSDDCRVPARAAQCQEARATYQANPDGRADHRDCNRELRKRAAPVASVMDQGSDTLARYPKLRATRVYDMVRERGFAGSVRTVREHVALVRPRPPREAYLVTETLPGEVAQI